MIDSPSSDGSRPSSPASLDERHPNSSSGSQDPVYRVKEIFRTVQGEGFWAGRPAVFVRMVGCNMWTGYEEDRARDAERTGADCPTWCDTDFTKEGSESLEAAEVVDRMKTTGGPIDFCVVTGGEPFLQLDATLVRAMQDAGYEVACETNGTIKIEETFWDDKEQRVVMPDWIVCSPKLPEDELVLERFDELKLVVPDYHPDAYGDFAERATRHEIGPGLRRLLWLQPEDGPRLEEAKDSAINLALQHPAWRVSVQTHKVLGVE
ncbi:7-carboxy-7-deazaguanine synthase QueE [Longibacter salinarum]|uniref:7-carboxy-7-deazaguanine synthase n=1 Tax=Longibacter salinarum TaxID=1850348 RepID=A0A2A8CZY1_9BACT|nr:7-carboxy-7-deazaguanine synthase QueE [Longibacter salinarum]PEN14245.1 7-carboxy-7-deazaguanine synthase QueE [Longibacter salinarum]